MATIAEQLTSLNTNLNTINTEVGNQEALIAQIRKKVESLPDAEGGNNSPSGRITDLTGTAWKLNSGTLKEPIAVHSNSYYSINFTSNGKDFVNIRSHDGQALIDSGYPDYPFIGYGKDMYSWTEVYVGKTVLAGTWDHYNYRILEITGGSDVTNENLIDMLYELGNPISSGGGGGVSSNIVSGTVTSNEYGEITFPMPEFEPRQIMVWNIREIDFDDYIGHDGVMLCAVKLQSDHWIAHYMVQGSGTYYIAQASAERSPFENDIDGYSWTNIYETRESLVWRLGVASEEDGTRDFTDITLNYVLIG